MAETLEHPFALNVMPPPKPAQNFHVAPARFVTIPLAAAITGLTASAMRTKISRGYWVEGREYVRAPDGHVFVDLRGFERWVAQVQG